ncbi:MAG: type IV-A pilus assembly ATPase PilB [Desulfonatronovibrionaceae bacterium]
MKRTDPEKMRAMQGSSLPGKLIKWAGLDEDQVRIIQAEQTRKRKDFARAALSAGMISQEDYRDFMAASLGLPAAAPDALEISAEAMEILDRGSWHKYGAVPFHLQDNKLFLACAEPDNITVLDDIRFMTGYEAVVHMATRSSIEKALDNHAGHSGQAWHDYAEAEKLREMDAVLEEEEAEDVSSLEAASTVPVVRMVNLIIMEAINKKASDIHIEIFEKQFRVRMRLDGVLRETMRPPLAMKNAVISRLKIMARLNIAEKRLPQDGRIKVRAPGGREVEFRVSVLPTLFGEKVVMRLLDRSILNLDLSALGLEESSYKAFEAAIKKPQGMVLVTGPTGSGKTTTLYSAIAALNQEGVNISTVEDPVEFSLPGVNQVNIHEEVGLTFASALRSFLRQDPDIILVGEIRDAETAEIAVKASLTGHLVLATLHTNDAPSTLTRLVNMGVESFLAASSVSAIMSQRLVRKLCVQCRRPAQVLPSELVNMGVHEDMAEKARLYSPGGCPQCGGTGYSGRTGVYEVLTVTREIQELMQLGASPAEMRDKAVEQGMITLRRSALLKVCQGLTSIEEIFRVTSA